MDCVVKCVYLCDDNEVVSNQVLCCEQCVVFIFFYIYGFVKHALNVCKCLCLSMFLFFMMLFQSK